MSLISTKNFIAPFTNRVHLIAILLVSILFATFRLSGGSLEMRGANERRESVFDRAPDNRAAGSRDLLFDTDESAARRETAPLQEDRVARTTTSRAPIDRDVMRELMENSRAREDQGTLRAPERREEKPSNSGLDDIERRLGMR